MVLKSFYEWTIYVVWLNLIIGALLIPLGSGGKAWAQNFDLRSPLPLADARVTTTPGDPSDPAHDPAQNQFRTYYAIDLGGADLSKGERRVYPAAAGRIISIENTFMAGQKSENFGNYVLVDHENGYYTLYGHLDAVDVSVGQRVDVTDKIGLMGDTGKSTGVHLHFQVLHGDKQKVDAFLEEKQFKASYYEIRGPSSAPRINSWKDNPALQNVTLWGRPLDQAWQKIPKVPDMTAMVLLKEDMTQSSRVQILWDEFREFLITTALDAAVYFTTGSGFPYFGLFWPKTALAPDASQVANLTPQQQITGGIASLPLNLQINWGTGAFDLDLHLTGPQDPSRFHVFFVDTGSLNNQPFALLHRDCICSGGSEVITVQRFNQGGVYRGSVFNFGDQSFTSTNLSTASQVDLRVIRGGTVVDRTASDGRVGNVVNGGVTVTTLSPSAGAAGNTWTAVEINPVNGQITTVNQISNSANSAAVP